ncbi:MAG TPA: alkaline phosphatase family protein [Nitrospirota bacterium]|nr:alkaline phosphatase family protein [Nitrospirota bacterium]
MPNFYRYARVIALSAALIFCTRFVQAADPKTDALQSKINHVIVIYQENWSFDGLYGKFPGANGLANAGDAVNQVDKEGKPLKTLKRPLDTSLKPPVDDLRFPEQMPAKPYDLAQYVPWNEKTGDLVHRFYQNQLQIDGGKMDKFAAWSDNPGLVMSYVDASDLPEGRLAKQYTIADNFFQAAFGGSFLNHFWLVCACTPVWPDAPTSMRVKLDLKGVLEKDGAVTPDGFVVNTAYSVNQPHPDSAKDLVPLQTQPTIGDLLSAKSVSWTWYSGGWNDALAGKPAGDFQFHHQPFAYFANFADNTPAKATHLKDEKEFITDLKKGALASVTFIKPNGSYNEHPGYAALLFGQQHVAELVKAVQESPYWNDSVIIITYDENGGRWDHVAPPKSDRWGPGARVPAIIISPFAKKGFVDHTEYDTTSILKLIERRWNLMPLGSRDAAANDLTNALDLASAPLSSPAR